MDELSRRALLSGAGLAVGSLIAGCSAPTAERSPRQTPTAKPEVTSTATPEPAADRPAFWGWLLRPDAVGGGYSFGSLAVPAVQSAGLARDRLAPTQFTPEQLHGRIDSTAELLTVSTGTVAGGVLRGEYDVDALGDALEAAGLSAEEDGVYTSDRLGFALDTELVRWADHPENPAGVLAALDQQLEEDRGSYPSTTPPVERALVAIRGASARFGRPLAVEDGPFATAQFLANGIGVSDGTVSWLSAVVFDGDVPDAAADEYRQVFVDREGFENVRRRTEAGLLVIESDVSADRAAATQPL